MNQEEHWNYTINEWTSRPYHELLDEAFTEPVNVIWDIGACVGAWSHVVERDFGPKEIYAFEPFRANFEYLREHCSATPLNFGIYYGKREANAMWRGANVGAIFIDEVDPTDSVPTHETFELRTLEELDLPKPDLIKFDVEGAELNIVKHSMLLKTVSQLLIEWHYREKQNGAEFFAKHLPHKVVKQIGNDMYLLRL